MSSILLIFGAFFSGMTLLSKCLHILESGEDKPHRKLRAWQIGMEIVEDVYRIIKTFPREELYGLISQMRRCAVSIPSNLAEGAARQSTREFISFLYISLGSISELDTQLELSKRFGYVSSSDWSSLNQKLREADRVIIGLIKSQKAKLPK